MRKKILIAMSGGVDSSVAALLLKEQGYACIGCTMKLHHEPAASSAGRTCCSASDAEDARWVAHRLGIPFYVFNFTEEFHRRVIDRFVRCYREGRTPNPCIDCNRYLKFGCLYERAKLLGCDYVATGHYARITKNGGIYRLEKAVDDGKEQSYVLFCLTQEQLSHTLFAKLPFIINFGCNCPELMICGMLSPPTVRQHAAARYTQSVSGVWRPDYIGCDA